LCYKETGAGSFTTEKKEARKMRKEVKGLLKGFFKWALHEPLPEERRIVQCPIMDILGHNGGEVSDLCPITIHAPE
jgi:hypothetical protein